jgi:predicted HNH restriction endonuclease
VKVHWLEKTPRQQKEASINDEIQREENAPEVEDDEGRLKPTQGFRLHRSSKLVAEVKKRDRYACRACEFNFKNQIVHVHHLDPLSEREEPGKTRMEDLITLCPNCHYLAHFYLRDRPGPFYKNRERLLKKLHSVFNKSVT